jgi:predicted PurR-regulated permease PerM
MSDKPVTINITTGTIVKAILIFFLIVLIFQLRDVVLIVLTAVVIASSVEPLTLWFGRHRIKRLPAVLIIYVVLVAILFGIVYFFLPAILREVSGYLSNLPKYLDYAETWFPIKGHTILENAPKASSLPSSFSINEIVSKFSASLTNASEGFVQTVSLIFGGVFSFILILVLSFYLAVQKDGIADFLRIVTPNRHEKYVIDLWRRSQMKIGFWMQGQLLLGLIVGVLVFLGLTVLGIQHALLLSLMAAAFELIPVFGPILSAIPGVFIGVADKGIAFGLVIAGLYIIIQQFENHLIYPLVVKKIVGVSPIVVILALIIGAKLAGFLGVLLSVPLAAILMEFLNDMQKGKHLVAPNS